MDRSKVEAALLSWAAQSERNQRIFLAALWAGFGLCAAGAALSAAQLCLPAAWKSL